MKKTIFITIALFVSHMALASPQILEQFKTPDCTCKDSFHYAFTQYNGLCTAPTLGNKTEKPIKCTCPSGYQLSSNNRCVEITISNH